MDWRCRKIRGDLMVMAALIFLARMGLERRHVGCVLDIFVDVGYFGGSAQGHECLNWGSQGCKDPK